MTSFTPGTLYSFKRNERVVATVNPVEVNLAEPGSLWYHDPSNKKVLIGYGTKFRVTLDNLNCELSATSQGTINFGMPRPKLAEGMEVFTNFDKRPQPSSTEVRVTLALRRFAAAEKRMAEQRRALDKAIVEAKGYQLVSDVEPSEDQEENDVDLDEVEEKTAE